MKQGDIAYVILSTPVFDKNDTCLYINKYEIVKAYISNIIENSKTPLQFNLEVVIMILVYFQHILMTLKKLI